MYLSHNQAPRSTWIGALLPRPLPRHSISAPLLIPVHAANPTLCSHLPQRCLHGSLPSSSITPFQQRHFCSVLSWLLQEESSLLSATRRNPALARYGTLDRHQKEGTSTWSERERLRERQRRAVWMRGISSTDESESEDPDKALGREDAEIGCKDGWVREVSERDMAAAARSIASQQQAGLPPAWDLARTRQMAETAMLAAVAGLAYTLSTVLKLEGYLSYVLPLPVVLAALRGGPMAAMKSLTVAFLLLFVLVGPVRAASFLLIYGFLSLALGISWSLKIPWTLSVPISSVARLIGYAAYLGLSSVMLGENLLALAIASVHSLLDQLSAFVGTSGSPSLMAVTITLMSLLAVNSLFYCFMMHVLYMILLRSMGYDTGPAPSIVARLFRQQQSPIMHPQR